MSEKCQRCGSIGEDRRTLWHACLYEMNELAMPFTERAIYGLQCGKNEGQADGSPSKFTKPSNAPEDMYNYPFYTLRVCKRCRADWLAAIKSWFLATPSGEDHDADEETPTKVNSGIFVRRNGATVEITREEWDAITTEKYGHPIEPVIAPTEKPE